MYRVSDLKIVDKLTSQQVITPFGNYLPSLLGKGWRGEASYCGPEVRLF